MKIQYYLYLTFLLILPKFSIAQLSESGTPFIKNYPPTEIITKDNKIVGTQFWDIAQDNDGRIYFGNSAAILIYDGVDWQLIRSSNKTVIRSIAVDKKINKVYIGAQDDIGYLTSDSIGRLQYQTLLDKIPKEERKFGNVWKTYVTEEGIFFQTFSHVFLLKDEKIKVFKPKSTFHLSFYVNNTFIVLDRKNGLFTLKNDRLEPLTGGNYFAGKRVYAALPLDQNTLILCSREKGLFLYKDGDLFPFSTKIDEQLKKAQIYNGLRLRDGSFVIATVRMGLIHLDKNGKILKIIDRESGLQDNGIFSLFEDRNNGIWAGLNNGISRISLNDPITFFNERNGLKGKGQCLIRFEGKIYTGTSLGVFYMDRDKNKNSGKPYTFKPLPTITTATWQMMNIAEGLLIGASQGLYFWKNNKLTEVFKGYALNLERSLQDSNRVYVGTLNGVIPVYIQNGIPKAGKKLNDIKGQVSGIEEDRQEKVWISVRNRELIQIDISEGFDPANLKIKKYREKQGLSPTGAIRPFYSLTGLVFGTDKGFYRYNSAKDKFHPDTLLNFPLVEGTQQSFRLRQDDKGNLWTGINFDPIQNAKYEVGKKVIWEYKPFLLLPQKSTRDILSEDDGIIWFSCVDGLYRFDSNIKNNSDNQFKTIIKNVKLIKDDTTLYGGYNYNEANNSSTIKVDYNHNSVYFEFAAPSFPSEGQTLFRYKLKGFDSNWSQWKPEKKKEFTNLPANNYTFIVEAKNVYENESSASSFSFTVLPPWYQTSWAFLLFAVLFIGTIYISVKYYNRRLQKENEKLETIVSQRTAQLREEKEKVEAQKEEILQQNTAISLQKEEIETQKDNLEVQKNEVEKAYNNISILSEIGRKITATLKIEAVIFTVYDYINTLMDASAFGIGIYNEKSFRIEFDGFIEKGKTIPYNYDLITDEKSLSVWCFKNKKEVIINDLINEYHNYIPTEESINTEVGEIPESIIYLPLLFEEKCIGVITVQSFKKDSYSERDIAALSTLASYVVIALDNAKAYHIIHTKNQHITDSIKYAQTIQKAILPSEEMLNESLKEYFVIYKPKDIVSGDFYWASATKNSNEELEKIFIAVADCTGHGVPGGFMSMISSTLINEIINIKKIHQPEQILELLDFEIRKALNQENSDNNDGLDMVLCLLEKGDSGASKITFSGAKRPFYYVEQKTGKINEIKGTSRGIGGTQKINKQKFKANEIVLQQGDIFYMSTDGLIDQPNPERKRFGTKQLKKLINDIASDSLENQKKSIEKALKEYQKDSDQRDDIALFGVRV